VGFLQMEALQATRKFLLQMSEHLYVINKYVLAHCQQCVMFTFGFALAVSWTIA